MTTIVADDVEGVTLYKEDVAPDDPRQCEWACMLLNLVSPKNARRLAERTFLKEHGIIETPDHKLEASTADDQPIDHAQSEHATSAEADA